MDIADICELIYSSTPKQPHSIELDFSELDLTIEEIFQQLLMIFTDGMKRFFGDENGKVDLEHISADDFKLMNEYFHSIGFSISYSINTEPVLKPKQSLKDYHLRLIVKNNIYVISFDILPIKTEIIPTRTEITKVYKNM